MRFIYVVRLSFLSHNTKAGLFYVILIETTGSVLGSHCINSVLQSPVSDSTLSATLSGSSDADKVNVSLHTNGDVITSSPLSTLSMDDDSKLFDSMPQDTATGIPKKTSPSFTPPTDYSLPPPRHTGDTELRRRAATERVDTVDKSDDVPASSRLPPHCGTASPSRPQTMTVREYAQSVEQWFYQQYWWTQQMNWMTWMYITAPMMAAASCMPSVPGMPPAPTSTGAPVSGPPARQAGAVPQPDIPQPQRTGGRECKIPTLSRRVAAEFLDFLLVFSVKLMVSIIAVDNGFNPGDSLFQTLPTGDVETLWTINWDANVALNITSELVLIEVINRTFICIFEAVCIAYLAATPGKRLMGIRVISCNELSELPGNRTRILPGGKVGLWNSLLRAAIKNFSLAFFFPVCLTVFFFPHNRTGYDVLSSSIVVELPEDDIWAIQRRR